MSLIQRIAYYLQRPPTVHRAGHPILRIPARKVTRDELTTRSFKQIVADMRKVFASPYTPVVGLAAPQIGHSIQLIGYQITDAQLLKNEQIRQKNLEKERKWGVAGSRKVKVKEGQDQAEEAGKPVPLTFLVNPTLTVLDTTDPSTWRAEYESCESLPSYNGLVRRAQRVQVDGWDLDGNDVSVKAAGFLARVLQHEVDHLQGVVYVEKLVEKSLRHDKYIDDYDMHVDHER
ncbi:RNAPII degradation factor [Quaeritorhiza haematococci]|nr:RNAPII degradation factor [Quaeritorhiza haematococci]